MDCSIKYYKLYAACPGLDRNALEISGIIWYTNLYRVKDFHGIDHAPSPSGKAGDFDSPIAGSTPAGATEGPMGVLLAHGRAFCFAGLHPL